MKSSLNLKLLGFILLVALLMTTCKKRPPGPNLKELIPNRGGVGSPLIITGSNLGYYNQIFFGQTKLTTDPVLNDAGDTMVLSVPTNIVLGIHKVSFTYEDGRSNSLDFEVIEAPTISSITPNSFAVGDTITITGTMLDLSSVSICFNDVTTNTFISQTENSISLQVPSGVNSGSIVVKSDNGTSNAISDFTILEAPVITSITPMSGFVGDEVTIAGMNFIENETEVVFTSNIPVSSMDFVSSEELKVIIPEGAETGDIVIQTSVGSAAQLFTIEVPVVLIPTITEVNPTQVGVGCEMTIFGTNFFSPFTVNFEDGVAATIIDSTTSQIKILVPEGATSGQVTVVNADGTGSIPISIVDVQVPEITRSLPKGNNLGGAVILYGENLNLTDKILFGETEQPYYEVNPWWTEEDYFGLHVPQSDAISGQVVPLRLKTSGGCFSEAIDFQVGTETSQDAPINANTVNVTIPVIPDGISLPSIDNDWNLIRNFNTDNPTAEVFFLGQDFETSCGDLDTCGVLNNSGEVIGRFIKDGSYMEVNLNGVEYIGAQDVLEIDGIENPDWLFRRLVLTPVEFGDQIEMLTAGYIDPYKSSYDLANNEVTVKGRFFSPDNEFPNFAFSYELKLMNSAFVQVAGTATYVNSTTLTFKPEALLDPDDYYIAALLMPGCSISFFDPTCPLSNGYIFFPEE